MRDPFDPTAGANEHHTSQEPDAQTQQPDAEASATNPTFDAGEFGKDVLSELISESRDVSGTVYADLAGKVLDAPSYAELLNTDKGFALQEIKNAIRSRVLANEVPTGISPSERRGLAKQLCTFTEVHSDIEPERVVIEFLRGRPALAVLSDEDITRVLQTTSIEEGFDLPPPTPSDIATLRSQLSESRGEPSRRESGGARSRSHKKEG